MTPATSPPAGPSRDAGSAPPATPEGEPPEPPDRPGVGRPEIRTVAFEGAVPYRQALELQRRLARERIEGRSEADLLLLMEHEPVVTLGRGAEPTHLVADGEARAARGVEAVEIERGGDVTYHGPGQLVGYPILDLRRYRKDLHWYLRAVEAALVASLGELGLPAFRVPEHTGVWVGERGAPVSSGRVRKVASIGVHVSRWVTWHGFALNVTDEPLENFDLIVPCGIEGVTMTTLESEGIRPRPARLREAVGRGFAGAFAARVVEGDLP